MIAVDVETEAVIGLVAAIWTRSAKCKLARRQRAFAEKESARWHAGCEAAAAILCEASSVTMVSDRESDIYPLFARRPPGLDLIVRTAHNRNLVDGGGVFEALAEAASLGTSEVRVARRGPGEKNTHRPGQTARRYGAHRPPEQSFGRPPRSIELTLVEAREIDAPKGEGALHWRLYTTYTVTNLAQANEVQLYRLRWRIEQTFRALKSDVRARRQPNH